MQTEHIIDLLEERPLSDLSEADRVRVKAHVVDCSDCLRAYFAADLSAELLRARAAESIEPSPYFSSRLMAALRERRKPTLAGVWKAGRGLVGSMAALVAILLGLTFYNLGTEQSGEPAGTSSSEDIYSAEWVILENGDASGDLTYSQVLETLYGSSKAYGEY